MDVINQKIVSKTNKPHRCFGCCNTFEKGTKGMDCCRIVNEGTIYNLYTCEECFKLMQISSISNYIKETIEINDGYGEGIVNDYFNDMGITKSKDNINKILLEK